MSVEDTEQIIHRAGNTWAWKISRGLTERQGVEAHSRTKKCKVKGSKKPEEQGELKKRAFGPEESRVGTQSSQGSKMSLVMLQKIPHGHLW